MSDEDVFATVCVCQTEDDGYDLPLPRPFPTTLFPCLESLLRLPLPLPLPLLAKETLEFVEPWELLQRFSIFLFCEKREERDFDYFCKSLDDLDCDLGLLPR